VAGAVDGSVLVWDAATGDLLLRLAGEGRDRLEPAVVRYSMAAELDPASPVGPGAVLKPLTGRTFGPADAEQAAIAAVGFSPDGSSVWATLGDGTVRIWNAREGSLATAASGAVSPATGAPGPTLLSTGQSSPSPSR